MFRRLGGHWYYRNVYYPATVQYNVSTDTGPVATDLKVLGSRSIESIST
jgi:hypothetical protein